jgi:hypothetical protein
MAHTPSDVLSARVTALMMIVETLFVDHLAEDDDPKIIKIIGDRIVKSAFDNEAKIRAKISGEDDYAMLITKELSDFVDRAVKRAIDQKQKPSPR